MDPSVGRINTTLNSNNQLGGARCECMSVPGER